MNKRIANRIFNSLENETHFHHTKEALTEILNGPTGIDSQAVKNIKTLYKAILDYQKGSGVNTRKAFKILSEQIMVWMKDPTNKDDQGKKRLSKMLLLLNTERTVHGRNGIHQKVFLGHVLTSELKIELKTLEDSFYQNTTSDVTPTSATDSPKPPVSFSPPSATSIPPEFIDYLNEDGITDAEVADREKVVRLIQTGGGLTSDQNFKFNNLNNLTRFPEGFNPRGDVFIEACKKLTTLPKFTQAKNVHLNLCEAFTDLPEWFNLTGTLKLSLCTTFTKFSEGFNPPGTVTMMNCGHPQKHMQWATDTNRTFTWITFEGRHVGFTSNAYTPNGGETVEI